MIPILGCFTLVGMNMWASASEDYETFSKSFISIFLMLLGKFSEESLTKANYNWSAFYFFLFYVSYLLLIVTIFIGIFIENHRIVIREFGYSNSFEDKWKFHGMGLFTY